LGIKRLLEDALWTQGVRRKSDLKRNRYEFQTNHGFRKWFKTQCELSGMKSIDIETIMGHSIGVSDSYYRITEGELMNEYIKAVDLLTINENSILKRQVTELRANKDEIVKNEVRTEIHLSSDAIASLSDQILRLQEEIELLKNARNMDQMTEN